MAPTRTPSHCLTSDGRRYEEGDGWHDGCRDCVCHAGREMCALLTCSVPGCAHPVVKPDHCCPMCEGRNPWTRPGPPCFSAVPPEARVHPVTPTCERVDSSADESGSGQPDEEPVCRAPGGDFYTEGETWNMDECTRCTCRMGRVLCDTEVCPPTVCHTPMRNKDTCCPVCPGRTRVTVQSL